MKWGGLNSDSVPFPQEMSLSRDIQRQKLKDILLRERRASPNPVNTLRMTNFHSCLSMLFLVATTCSPYTIPMTGLDLDPSFSGFSHWSSFSPLVCFCFSLTHISPWPTEPEIRSPWMSALLGLVYEGSGTQRQACAIVSDLSQKHLLGHLWGKEGAQSIGMRGQQIRRPNSVARPNSAEHISAQHCCNLESPAFRLRSCAFISPIAKGSLCSALRSILALGCKWRLLKDPRNLGHWPWLADPKLIPGPHESPFERT